MYSAKDIDFNVRFPEMFTCNKKANNKKSSFNDFVRKNELLYSSWV